MITQQTASFEIVIKSNDETEVVVPAFGAETIEDAKQFARDHWKASDRAERSAWLSIRIIGELFDETLYNRAAKLTDLAAGHYGFQGKRYHISTPADGKWVGFIFVATGSEYHDRKTIATIKPDGTFSMRTGERGREVAKALSIDPAARMAEYGRITGQCGRCGRVLEDETSRAIGLGPVCRQKV